MADATIFRISVAFDERTRASVQSGLDRLASSSDLDSDEGRAAALRATLDLLASAGEGATHCHLHREVLDDARAPEVFDAAAAELRGRYPHETRRNASTAAAPEVPESDAPGSVVVTLLTGWAARLETPSTFAAKGELQGFLSDGVPPVPLVALEVIWSPSVDRDRMSAEAMAEKYPELAPLSAG